MNRLDRKPPYMPLCPFCGKSITVYEADMHEALISKGQVRGNKNANFINSRYNCVIRHHDATGCKHTGGVGGQEAFEQAAQYLVRWEGYEHVLNFLKQAVELWPIVGRDALQRFEGLNLKETI